MKIMVPTTDVSVIHHEGKVYKPNKKGQFEIDDGHVDALRAHGLRLEAEVEQAATAEDLQKQLDAANAAKADLEKQIAELQAKK